MNQTPLEQDPAIYLRHQATSTSPCHLLVEQVGSRDDDHVPMHMLAKIAVRLHQVVDWMARWDGREKFARRAGAALAALALANIGAVATSWIHAHDARIEAAAEARAADQAFREYRDSIRRELERMDKDISDLRRALWRLGGSDAKDGVTIVQSEARP